MVGGFRQIIAKEGAGALLTGLGPTVVGYSIQGALKFGGYVKHSLPLAKADDQLRVLEEAGRRVLRC
jgi:hypothetical protein